KLDRPWLRASETVSTEHTVSASVGSYAHVFMSAVFSGLPRARTNTEYVVVPEFVGSAAGRWNAAGVVSEQLLSRTWKEPSLRLILQLPESGTKITLPLDPVVVFGFWPLPKPMRFKL